MLSCYEKALSYLASREHSEREVEVKLKNKGYKKEEIETTLKQLKEEGYLSDYRFASLYISSRMRKMPEGRAILLMRLYEKGVSREVANRALDQYFEENSEEAKEAISRYKEKIIKQKGEDKGTIFLKKKGLLSERFQD